MEMAIPQQITFYLECNMESTKVRSFKVKGKMPTPFKLRAMSRCKCKDSIYYFNENRSYKNSLQKYIPTAFERGMELLDEPLSILIIVSFPCNLTPIAKPDWDNLSKTICDSCSGTVFKDDALIIDAKVMKRQWDQDVWGIDVYIKPINMLDSDYVDKEIDSFMNNGNYCGKKAS